MTDDEHSLVGELSYDEWHVFVNGPYAGLTWGWHDRDTLAEQHYFRAGHMAGTFLQYTTFATVLYLWFQST